MRDPTSPDTLTARLAALRASALPAAPAATSASSPSAPTSPARDEDEDDTDPLAERLARLRAPATSSFGAGEAGPRVPVGFKGVEDLEGSAKKDDEVERFMRQVEEEERGGQGTVDGEGAQLAEEDKDDLVQAILRSRSPPSGPLAHLPSPPSSPPSSPPLSRARRSIPALSPSLLDTLSGVEVQFFRPGLEAPSYSDSGALGGAARWDEQGEVAELMRQLKEEGEVELRQGAVKQREDDAAARGWEARLAGLGGAGAGASGARGRQAALGAAPPREGVDEVSRAAGRHERRRSGKREGRSASDSESSESSESSEEEDESEEEVSAAEEDEEGSE